MRFCIYGAGAIGGYVAVELASAGHDVIPNLEDSQ
jgi:ketopantoate reductase